MKEEIIIGKKDVVADNYWKEKYADIHIRLTNRIAELERERDELKKACEKCKLFDIEKTNRDLLEQIEKLEQENKELSFAIEKCLENAGIECDDEEQALRSLPMLGNAHYKVLVEKEELEQENKNLKKQIESQKGLITVGGKQQYEMTMAYDKCKTALEEIRENLVKLKTNDEDDFTYEYSKIQDKINEILN